MNLFKKIATAVSVAAICTVAILALSSCGDCNHTYNSWTVTRQSTCVTAGERVRSCMYCGEQQTESLSKNDHTYGDYVSDDNASCISMGTKTAACKIEGCTATKSERLDGNAPGHNYQSGVCAVCEDTMTLVESFDASADGSVKVNVYKGENEYYALDVIGNGAMADYTAESSAPWSKYKENIVAVHIYEGVTSIGDRAFYDLIYLEDIVIGNGLKTVGTEAFKPGFAPERVYIPNVKTWSELQFEESGIPSLYLTGFIYLDWKIIDHLTVEEGVEHINPYAFYNNATLISIHMPTTLKSIGDWAFYGCGKLDELHISSLEAWCSVSFAREYSNPLRYAKDLFLNDAYVTDLKIPATITTISSGAFEGCDGLKSVAIEGEDVVIESYAFYECEGLESITLGDTVKIGDWAFYGCLALKEVSLDGISEVGNDAFRACIEMTSASLSANITSVGNDIFSSCTKLTTVVFDGTEAEWEALGIVLPEGATVEFKS